ncbi:sensor histidine kinase [Nocardioides yefusunii]|uniref:Sensor histidine kinase n=1 Tax=Nocardioides yefusunii TaxID=2500546 RepID=A0ABW1QY61_9ACTN|nr:sensor histidine kinase [Nocardioides yefusunii]
MLALVAAAALWTREPAGALGLVELAVIWGLSSWLLRTRTSTALVHLGEAAAVALVATVHLGVAPALVAAVAVPPFAHGLVRGLRGVLHTLLVQSTVMSVVVLVSPQRVEVSQTADLFTWLVTGLGLGLIASFYVSQTTADTTTRAYGEARELLTELNHLAGELTGGLDPSSMGAAVLEQVHSTLPLERAALWVEREGALLPLVDHAAPAHSDDARPEDGAEPLAQRAWQQGCPVVEERAFAFAVTHHSTPIAVVTGTVSPGLRPEAQDLLHVLERLAAQIAPAAVRLDAAQLFVSFRDAAMRDERRRMAREMHDGMAQDIASMGYVVDALISTATPQQEQALRQLRSMITRVVGEVRRSVMTLRTQAGASESLGAAIATMARHLSDVSGTPIHVTVDERTTRLRHEVEAELLRIAQEAMNNAVRHAHAGRIDVRCRVHAPFAEVEVQDDGLGLQAGRRDSHGLSIMRERASLINGVLEVRSTPDQGTLVRVRVGTREESSPAPPSERHAPVSTPSL